MQQPSKNLLNQVRDAIRLKHYSYHTFHALFHSGTSAFAEVTSEEREALQKKPMYSGFAATSYFIKNVIPEL
jgi:hypothetical protein